MGEKQSSTAAGEEEKEELTLKCICLVFFFRIISPGSMGMYWTIVSYLQSLTGYASIRAIESPSKVDDEQWLTYWILYSFLTLVEMAAATLFSWIPFWHPVKLAFIAWLVLPQFRGASFIYQRFVGEQLIKYRQWVFVLLDIFLIILINGSLLVLLVLRDEVIHVGLGFSEFHLVHALTSVPMEESFSPIHSRELLRYSLEDLLDSS